MTAVKGPSVYLLVEMAFDSEAARDAWVYEHSVNGPCTDGPERADMLTIWRDPWSSRSPVPMPATRGSES